MHSQRIDRVIEGMSPVATVLARMNVTYDAGYFDKDEQGWCSNHHRLSVDGDTVHVERWGDYAGREPFSVRWDARIVEVDAPNELVVLVHKKRKETLIFDLRAQRLLGSWNQGQEQMALVAPPAFETAEMLGRYGFSWLETVWPSGDEPPPPPDPTVLKDVEHLSIRRRTTGLLRGELEVGRIDVLYAPPEIVHGIDVSRTQPQDGRGRLEVTWRAAEPLTLLVRGGFAASELRPIRETTRKMPAPLLCRPSLVLRALVAEAREVGSMLSYLDHGGGPEAHARIQRAGEIGSSLASMLPDAVRGAGATEAARAFGQNPSSAWTALERLGSEIFTRPTGLRDAFADVCVVRDVLFREASIARPAAAALAGAALSSLPGDAPQVVRRALVATRDATEEGDHGLSEALEAFMPLAWGPREPVTDHGMK